MRPLQELSAQGRLSRPVVDAHRTWTPPEPVRRAVMVHRWDDLSFIHWPCEPHSIQRLLPPGLEVDPFDGAGWIGLIPFRLTVCLPGTPAIPWVSSCPEINVRTYVRGPDGRPGIWFFSLEAARLPAVLLARGWYHLPYKWARMRMRRQGPVVKYESRRRWPGSTYPHEEIMVSLGPSIPESDVGAVERFLIGRWRLFSPMPEGLAATQVEHPPWQLRSARVRLLRDELVLAAGLPPPSTDLLVHFSSGVRVRFARRTLLE